MRDTGDYRFSVPYSRRPRLRRLRMLFFHARLYGWVRMLRFLLLYRFWPVADWAYVWRCSLSAALPQLWLPLAWFLGLLVAFISFVCVSVIGGVLVIALVLCLLAGVTLADRRKLLKQTHEMRSSVLMARGNSQPKEADRLATDVEPHTHQGAVEFQCQSQRQLLGAMAALVRISGSSLVPEVVDADIAQRRVLLKLPADSRLIQMVDPQDTVSPEVDPDQVLESLSRLHALGVCLGSPLGFSRLLVREKNGTVLFIDLGAACVFDSTHSDLFRYLRDRDIEAFNQLFGSDRLTRARIRRKIAERSAEKRWYAPVDLGYGIMIGKPWDIGGGTGKWRYIVQPALPNITGARVLDIGCNNGVFSLEVLRAGARTAIGIERDPVEAEGARFLHRAFEWADMRKYDFTVLTGDVTDVLSDDMGIFDVVLALNVLYYLDDEKIERVVRQISSMSPLLLVQCNIIPGDHTPEIRRRSTVEYLSQVLQSNGFASTTVRGPKGYLRPLIVASRHEDR